MNDRPERYMFKGKLVPKVCSLCNHKLYEWQYKRVYIGAVVHMDCFKDNHEAEKRELAEKFGTVRVNLGMGREKLFKVDTSGAKTTTSVFDDTTEPGNLTAAEHNKLIKSFGMCYDECFTSGEKAWKKALGETIEEELNEVAEATIEKMFNKAKEQHDKHIEKNKEVLEYGEARTFDSGATRDTDKGKLDFEAFLSPAVLVRYAQHLHAHRIQSDGKERAGDNWQKGISLASYMKSLDRHFMDVWLHHRDRSDLAEEDLETALCGVMFNSMGYLFEVLKKDKK